MTIKTLKEATSTSSISLNSINKFGGDMPKSGGAVRRNLFGSVDRNNLNEQVKNSKRENERALSNYKPESIIGVLNRNDEDQARRLKCLPAITREEKRRQSCSSNQTLQSMMLRDHSASSSTISSSSSFKLTESAKLLSTQKAINHTLPKGQKTIKDYYPTVKKSRQNQR